MNSLEPLLAEVAQELVGNDGIVHIAYSRLNPESAKASTERARHVQLDLSDGSRKVCEAVEAYVRGHNIRYAIGFDQPVSQPGYAALRRGGVQRFVAYWGAPMSSLNTGLRLRLKRLQVSLQRSQPNHYIFESEGMRATAVYGRGIPYRNTSVCYLGVDPARFSPAGDSPYAHEAFSIPTGRRIIVYAGHMEARKGVSVIVRAAVDLVCERRREDVHFLFLGDRPGEAQAFAHLYKGTRAEAYITFGGYRRDVERIFPGCYAGVIASTGWDSFTCSSLEMAASGVPVIVSDIPGLNEAVQPGVTGFNFPPSNARALADILVRLLDSPRERDMLGEHGRARVVRSFSRAHQRQRLTDTLRRVMGVSTIEATYDDGVTATSQQALFRQPEEVAFILSNAVQPGAYTLKDSIASVSGERRESCR